MTKLTTHGSSVALIIPRETLEATGFKQGDSLYLTARNDGVIEIRSASTEADRLDKAFNWSLDRYPTTFRNLAE